jgi:hypothetical protein
MCVAGERFPSDYHHALKRILDESGWWGISIFVGGPDFLTFGVDPLFGVPCNCLHRLKGLEVRRTEQT